ncbi:MAG TPA: sigma-70 family RNA polymerase sigma factor [Chitinophaga sp.]|uniref:RNA polymerase sigma factor n=1 Tax=Chitinophaga sp. TaxID=1869181 RepID=UPI002CB300D5|nr:sigma-70 family RNA polymerase sigma factor [Chitinophaga sp.]HVI43510.1 sigma-70 family RNA polymerase sigma factor [Chitinophaga sp.]
MLFNQSMYDRFELIFFTTKDRLFSFIFKFTRNQHQAEDIMQCTYLKLWENINSTSDDTEALPLLCTYAKNLMIDTFRKEAQQRKYIAYLQENTTLPDSPIVEQLSTKEYKSMLMRAVERLPPQSRLVYKLKREDGLSLSQIATQLEISTSTVEGHMNKALKLLKKELKGNISLSLYIVLLERLL